jgi:hypothetical protein
MNTGVQGNKGSHGENGRLPSDVAQNMKNNQDFSITPKRAGITFFQKTVPIFQARLS